MRLTTEIWVSALLRRVFSGGGFAAIERRGSAEAGTVFLLVRDRQNQVSLYEPAPQSMYDDRTPADRRFCCSDRVVDAESAARRIDSEIRFDGDVWVVELEPGSEPVETLITIAAT